MSAGSGYIFITDQWWWWWSYYYYYYYLRGGGGGPRTNVWAHNSGYAVTDSVPCYQRNISQSISFFHESKAINLQHDANHIDMVIPSAFFLGGHRGTRTPKHFVNLTGESKSFS
jgi:hypothetical protein